MRIERAELAVDNARAVDLLERWQEHRIPCRDVDAIAGPQPDGMAAAPRARSASPSTRSLENTGRNVLYWTIRLPPCDQIIECVNVWRKAEGNPTDGAPKNNSVTHRLPPN